MLRKTLLMLAFLSPLAAPLNAGAQDSVATQAAAPGVLRGTVTSSAGGPLPYAVITITSLNLQQFANNQGKFYFTKIPAGKYRMNVRQLGYQALTVDVVIGPNGSENISVQMDKLATRLAAVQVLDEWRCTKPGPPGTKSGDLPLLEVFEQLEQNAVRLRLLVKEYPYDLLLERRRTLQRDGGNDSVQRVDTTRWESTDKAKYEKGSVVKRERMPDRTQQYFMQIPTLLDFVHDEFQKNHCFILRGVDYSQGRPQIRVDFKASDKIQTPDVEGSVFLEDGTFRLRRTEIRLTRIPAEVPGLTSLTATTYFDEIVPGMPVVTGINALSNMRPTRNINDFQRAVEQHSALTLKFSKKRPEGVPPLEAQPKQVPNY